MESLRQPKRAAARYLNEGLASVAVGRLGDRCLQLLIVDIDQFDAVTVGGGLCLARCA